MKGNAAAAATAVASRAVVAVDTLGMILDDDVNVFFSFNPDGRN
jgi:hypothetical protein